MAWLNNLRIIWKVMLIVALLGAVSFASIGFAALRMQRIDEAYSDLVNRVDRATVAMARGSRDVESYVSVVYQLLLEATAEGSSRLLARNAEERKLYEQRFAEALRLMPEKAYELNPLHGTGVARQRIIAGLQKLCHSVPREQSPVPIGES